jgi:hypothetical protein
MCLDGMFGGSVQSLAACTCPVHAIRVNAWLNSPPEPSSQVLL